MEEIWKDIKGYEGLYQISNLGRVKSLPKVKRTPTTEYITKARFLPWKICKGGYYRVSLSKKSKSKYFSIHRLVANAFLGENGDLTVNHKDENKANNSVENLEYMSLKDNIKYGTGIKRSALRRIDNPLICTPVNQYTLDGEFVKRYPSIKKAKEENGWSKENISLCCNHKRNQSNGYIWRHDGDLDISYQPRTNGKVIIQYSKDGDFIKEYPSAKEAFRQTNTHPSDICMCCKGKNKTANGYKWKYKE